MKATYSRRRNKDGSKGDIFDVRMEGPEVARLKWGDTCEVTVETRGGKHHRRKVRVVWIGDNRYGEGKIAIAQVLTRAEQAEQAAAPVRPQPKPKPAPVPAPAEEEEEEVPF